MCGVLLKHPKPVFQESIPREIASRIGNVRPPINCDRDWQVWRGRACRGRLAPAVGASATAFHDLFTAYMVGRICGLPRFWAVYDGLTAIASEKPTRNQKDRPLWKAGMTLAWLSGCSAPRVPVSFLKRWSERRKPLSGGDTAGQNPGRTLHRFAHADLLPVCAFQG